MKRRILAALIAAALCFGVAPASCALSIASGNSYKDNLATNKQYLESIEEKDYRYTAVSHDVYRLSNYLCQGLDNDRERLRALYKWVTDNIYYDLDNAGSLGAHETPSAQTVLDNHRNVCQGYATLFQGLCAAQDIPCTAVDGVSFGVGHAWNAVQVDGKWLWADATWDCNNRYENDEWRSGRSESSYFLCSTETISANHTSYRSASQDNYDRDKANGASAAKAAESNGSLSGWALTEVQDALCTGLVPSSLMDSLNRYGQPASTVYTQESYNGEITREEFCALMTQLVTKHSGKSIRTYMGERGVRLTENPFTDVRNSDTDVLAAYALGIVKGKSETTFDPNGHITRQEAATMLARTGRLLGVKAQTPATFVDREEFADWATDGIDFVSSLKDPYNGKSVMGDTGDGSFSPLASYSREQAIITALRLFSAADNHTVRSEQRKDG